MDSQDYFKKAQRSTRIYHTVVIVLLIIMIGVLVVAGTAVFQLNSSNHKTSDQQLNVIAQDIKNSNLNNEYNLKCLVDQGYKIGPNPPQTVADQALLHCIQVSNQPVRSN